MFSFSFPNSPLPMRLCAPTLSHISALVCTVPVELYSLHNNANLNRVCSPAPMRQGGAAGEESGLATSGRQTVLREPPNTLGEPFMQQRSNVPRSLDCLALGSRGRLAKSCFFRRIILAHSDAQLDRPLSCTVCLESLVLVREGRGNTEAVRMIASISRRS